MSQQQAVGPIEGIVLCPVASADGAAQYTLLPTLAELVRRPGFGLHDPICLPGTARPLDGWALFGSARGRKIPLH